MGGNAYAIVFVCHFVMFYSIVMLFNAMTAYAMSCYAMSCYVIMLCHVML